jgi:hypothetical protein
MKIRVIGAVIFGAGVFLLVAAAALAFVIAPSLKQLPYDLDPSTSVAEAPNATFLEIKPGQVEVKQATLRSTIEIIPDPMETEKLPEDLKGNVVVWDAYQNVIRTDDQYEISKYSAELALNRRSGAPADWDGQWLAEAVAADDPGNVKFVGQIYKFPFGTEKRTYQVWDRDLRTSLPAEFKGTETIEGVEVYRFEQVVAEQPAKNVSTESLSVLLGRFAPEATSGQVMYSNTRTLWVEPTTGMYIKVREEQHKELVPATGASTVLLDADFEYNQETITKAADRAGSNRAQLNLISIWAPLGLAIIGLLLVIYAFVLGRRAASGGAHRSGGGPASPAPAHNPAPARKDGGVLTDELPAPVTPAPGGPAGIPGNRSDRS